MNLLKQFFKYAIPSIASMWVFSIYTMADGIFVAKGVGERALAAVNIAMPFINAIFAVSLWLAVGTSTVIAIAMGRGDTKRANEIFSMNTVMLVIISVVITVLALFNLRGLATFLGATASTIDYVQDYLRIIILFSGCFIVSYCLEVLIKTDGFPILATVGVCISALCNIVLDFIFVLVLHWGIQGAAIATGISQLALLLFFLYHFTHRKSTLKFTAFQWDLRLYKRILPIGFSDCITEFSTGIVTFMFNRTILMTIGDDGIVSYTIITYVNTLTLMTMIGLTQGMQPLVSFYYGKREMSTGHKLLRYALVTVAGCSLASFALCQLFAAPLVNIFINAEHIALSAYSVYALKRFAYSFLIMGFNVVIAGFFAAIERPIYSLAISLARGLLLVPIGLLIMVLCFGPDQLWLATTVSESLTLLVTLILILRYRAHYRLVQNEVGS